MKIMQTALCCLLFIASQCRATLLSTVLSPTSNQQRQGRSSYYQDDRYGIPRTLIDDRRCQRCYQDRDRPYDIVGDHSEQYDDRRLKPRPTYGNRYDDDRRSGDKRNETPNYEDNRRLRRPYDDRRPDDRRYDRDRYYDDYDAYPTRNRQDYYERHPVRDPYSDDYRRRTYDRYDDPYGRIDPYAKVDPYARVDPYTRVDPYARDPYDDYRDRPLYDAGRPLYDGYGDNIGSRGNGYDDRGYGMRSRFPERYDRYDSFRPWDETYRGVSGFDDAGRGYYFASGRPEVGGGSSGWRNVNERPRQWGNPRWKDQSSDRDPGAGGTRPSAPAQDGGYGQNGNFGREPSGSSSTTPGNSYLYQREDDRVTEKSDSSTEKNKS